MNRISHIDNAKAIGVMLIVMSHLWVTGSFGASLVYQQFNNIVNSFYVPLFFLLSGIFEPSRFEIKKQIFRLLKLAKFIVVFLVFGYLSAYIFKDGVILMNFAQYTVVWFLIVLFLITTMTSIVTYIHTIFISDSCRNMWCISKFSQS